MTDKRVDDTRPQRSAPWEVVERERFQRPPNEIRFAGTMRHAIAALLLSLAAIALAAPAVSRQLEFRDIVVNAADQGFPDVPPAILAIGNHDNFVSEWNITCDQSVDGIPYCDYVAVLSDQRLDYENDYNLLMLGVIPLFLVILITLAYAFSRALNNLYALGFETSYIPPAWAFAGFLIPVINLFLPWLVVSRVWRTAWTPTGRESAGALGFVGAAWGVMAAATVFLNPWVTGWIIRRSDIDGWALNLWWVSFAIAWTVAAAIVSSLVLTVVAWRQGRRYRAIEAAALA